MPFHRPSAGSAPGYSLIEILVVLAVLGVLSLAGVTILGNRRANAVRVLLDELEGALLDAQKYATSTGRDTALVSWGTKDNMTTLGLARGDAAQTSAAIKTIIDNLRLATPTMPATDLGKTVAPVFLPSTRAEHQYAGIVVTDSNWWTNAAGGNESHLETAPFKNDSTFKAATTDATNLFSGNRMISSETHEESDLNQVFISGTNGRFTSSFHIRVVGTSNGLAQPGGAMGLLVVLNNGGSVYKFYNPGSAQGDGKWRRI